MNRKFRIFSGNVGQLPMLNQHGIGLVSVAFICQLSLLTSAQSGPSSPPPGIVAWWTGDGDARNIVDDNKLLDGVLMNGASATTAGFVGKAFSFDGIDAYVRLPNLVQAQPEGTVEFWFKLNTWNWSGAPAGRYLWSSTLDLPDSGFHTDGVNLGCHVQYTGTGELIFGVWDTPFTLWHWARSGFTPETNVWYHVAGTWGPGGVSIFVNGALLGWDHLHGAGSRLSTAQLARMLHGRTLLLMVSSTNSVSIIAHFRQQRSPTSTPQAALES